MSLSAVVKLSVFLNLKFQLKTGNFPLVTNTISCFPQSVGLTLLRLRRCLPHTQISVLLKQSLFFGTTLVLQGPAEVLHPYFPLVTESIKKHCNVARLTHFTVASRAFVSEAGCLVVEERGASAVKSKKVPVVATLPLQMCTRQKGQIRLVYYK